MLAGDLGRRTGRSQSYPRSSLGVPRQVLTHGAVKLTFRGGQLFGISPLFFPLLNTYNKRETGGVGAEGKPHAGEESVPHRHSRSEAEA